LDEPSPAILELVRRHAQPLGLTDARSLTAIFPAADVLARMRLEWLPPATARTIRMVSANSDRIEDPGFLPELVRAGHLPDQTAQTVALRAFGDPDAFPAADAVLVRESGASSSSELAAIAEPWRPWRAYAAVHLWRAASERDARSRERAARYASFAGCG